MGFKTEVKTEHPEDTIWFMSDVLAINFMNKVRRAKINVRMHVQDTLLLLNRQLTKEEYNELK